jgi:hypothetical protein
VFFLEPLKPILPAEDQEITSPFLFVKEMMMLLKVANMSFTVDSTITLRFAVALVLLYYLVAFLVSNSFSLPFLVLELFLVLCPLNGRPVL